MKGIGMLLMILNFMAWIMILVIIIRVIRTELFRTFFILKWHKKMLLWILLLSTLMLILAFLGGKYA